MITANKKTIPIREIYIILILSAAMLFGLIYSSMALFQKTVEKVGMASIVASEINYTLTSDESSFSIDGNSGTITVAAGESKAFNITIKNTVANSTRYKMYYRFSNDITILDVEVGISSSSESPLTDLISTGTSKTVRVMINNNSTQSATIEIGVQGGYAINPEVVLNTGRNEMSTIKEITYPIFVDTSGANEPILADGMIPVVYDDENDVWLKADEEAGYYAYQDQVWANAVTVTSTNRSTYLNADPGTEIPMSDINSMWVWIPRFNYKIPCREDGSCSSSDPNSIDVEFEIGENTTGVSVSTSGVGTSEFYTHPAFRDGSTVYESKVYDVGGWSKELTGLWIAKFEIGGESSAPLIKPNIISLNGMNMNELNNACTLFSSSNNDYGLPTTSTKSGSHMIKNTEWGAVAILSQSQYGKMGNGNYEGANKEIYDNNSTSTYTGRSSGTVSTIDASESGNYSYEVANSGTGASTTGTIYGVYDMSGGSAEYVMTVYGSAGAGNSGINSSFYQDSNNRHLFDRYGANSDSFSSTYILGDATWETKGWYGDWGATTLKDNSSNSYYYLIRRGGTAVDSTQSHPGIFNYGTRDGSGSSGDEENVGNTSSRPVYIP